MKYVVQECDWEIFLQRIPNGKVDLILTDPPYNISRKTGFIHGGVERFQYTRNYGDWDHQEIDIEKFTNEAYRILRTGGTIIIWYDMWKITRIKESLDRAGFKMVRGIIWVKQNPVPINAKSTYLSNAKEFAVVAVKGGKPTFNSYYEDGVYYYPIPTRSKSRKHPTMKPDKMFEDLILRHSKEGDLVVDPFVGSGTTAIAAVRNRRKFAGCDINSEYVDMTLRSI